MVQVVPTLFAAGPSDRERWRLALAQPSLQAGWAHALPLRRKLHVRMEGIVIVDDGVGLRLRPALAQVQSLAG